MVEKFLREMENITVYVADNKIKKDLLQKIITSLIYEDDYSEELKLKIYNSINY
jgi:death-on-curing protein